MALAQNKSKVLTDVHLAFIDEVLQCKFRFGKYQGQFVKDVDDYDYLEKCFKNKKNPVVLRSASKIRLTYLLNNASHYVCKSRHYSKKRIINQHEKHSEFYIVLSGSKERISILTHEHPKIMLCAFDKKITSANMPSNLQEFIENICKHEFDQTAQAFFLKMFYNVQKIQNIRMNKIIFILRFFERYQRPFYVHIVHKDHV